jgi:uncharacterized coiled-coil protein SlyX
VTPDPRDRIDARIIRTEALIATAEARIAELRTEIAELERGAKVNRMVVALLRRKVSP